MRNKIVLLALLVGSLAAAQGVAIKSGATSDLATVNTQNALLIQTGISTRPTYAIVASGLTTSSAYNLGVEAGATGFKLLGWCVSLSNATAAAAVTVAVNRRTAASTGGTLCVAEQSSSCSVSAYDPTDVAFDGIGRSTGTLGTIGALVDSVGFMIGELGAGAADPPGPAPFCRFYGMQGEKVPTIASGVANGISVTITSLGAGGLASGGITMYVIQE